MLRVKKSFLYKLSSLSVILILLSSSISWAELTCISILSERKSADESRPLVALESKQRDLLALEAIRLIELKKKSQSNTVKDWLLEIVSLQDSRPLSVLEHTALAYIHNSQIFHSPEGETNEQILNTRILQLAIKKSYEYLSGEAMPVGGEFKPLPVKALKSVSTRARLFHDEIFIDAVLKAETLKSPRRLRDAFRPLRLRGLARRVNIVNVATVLMTATALSFEAGRSVFAGALIGLTQASFNEYFVHIGIGHAPESFRKWFRKLGTAGKFMDEITLVHHLHHLIVSKKFAADQLPPEIQERADFMLNKLVEKYVSDRFAEANLREELKDKYEQAYQNEVDRIIVDIKAANYGIDGTVIGAVSMLTLATPFYLLNLSLYAAIGDPILLVSSVGSTMAWIVQSLYSHKYMHIHPDDLDTTPGTSAFQRWYRRSYVGELQTRLHFVHHGSPWDYARTQNGIIMAFSVADRVLRGVEYPSLKFLLEMDEDGLLGE